jgi:hypothetical protein
LTDQATKVGCGAMMLRSALSATVAAVALFAAPGCARVVTGTPNAGTQAAATAAPKRTVCKEVSAPMAAVPARAAHEPQLRIPRPPGWQRTNMLDSEIIRFAMGNKDLAGNNFVPTTVVTLESAPSTNQDQQKIFDQERATLADRLGVTNMRTTHTSVCGHKADLVSYDVPAMGRIPPRKAKTLIVVAEFSGNDYAATVTVQAADPDNPGYVRDTQTILSGFQLLPPDKG